MHALIDCGATGIAFLDQDLARHDHITLQALNERKHDNVIKGTPSESGDIMHIASVTMGTQDHDEQLPMFITNLGHCPILLAIPRLRLNDVAVPFASNTVSSCSHDGVTHCHYAAITVQGVTEAPQEPVSEKGEGIFEPQI